MYALPILECQWSICHFTHPHPHHSPITFIYHIHLSHSSITFIYHIHLSHSSHIHLSHSSITHTEYFQKQFLTSKKSTTHHMKAKYHPVPLKQNLLITKLCVKTTDGFLKDLFFSNFQAFISGSVVQQHASFFWGGDPLVRILKFHWLQLRTFKSFYQKNLWRHVDELRQEVDNCLKSFVN
jgi:hypothetical protein